MTFADRLKALAGSDKMADIARFTGLSYNTVKNYLSEGRTPNGEILLQIAEKTGANIHWLLTGEGAPIANQGATFREGTVRIAKYLAEAAIPAEHLDGFLRLPLDSQLVGLAVLAHAAGETRVKGQLLEILKGLHAETAEGGTA